MSLRRIVIPTDFSENAFNAIQYACLLLKYQQCEFFLLHAYADEVYELADSESRNSLETQKDRIYKEAQKQLSDLRDRVGEYSPNPKHKYHTLAAFGTLTDEINDLVNDEDLDLVIMGTRGLTNDRSIPFGSKTVQVFRYVQCPVLAIPENYEYNPPKTILFPSNFLIPYKRRELKLVCELSGSFRSSIHLLYIDPVEQLSHRQEDNLRFLKENLFKANLGYKTSDEKDKAVAIAKYIIHHKIDLLVMVNTKHTHLENMLKQSTLDKLGLHLKIPFLVLQNLSR